MSVFDINSAESLRRFLYGFVPTLGTVLVGAGILTETAATQWVGLVLAILSPAVATIKTQDGFRMWLYPVVTAAGAIFCAWGIVSDANWQLGVVLVTALLGGVAAGNTHDEKIVSQA